MPTRIEKLADNSTMYYRGDTCLEISPFTNYYMFTIYRENNDEQIDDHIPLNLTNLGTLWLSFINGGNKIRIPNYTEAENIDMANGEVVFRISEEYASKILALSSKTFYISSAITDGNTKSDETVLFSGSWSEYSTAMKASLTDTVAQLKENIRLLEEQNLENTEEFNKKLNDANNEITKLQSENDRLNAYIAELEAKLDEANINYIDATIIDSSDNSIPQAAKTMNEVKINLQANAVKLEKTTLKSTFKTKTI